MPIYEYQCEKCGKISQHLVLNTSNFSPFCKKCGSTTVKKLISKVIVRLSDETRLERLADPNLLSDVENDDPKAIKKYVEKLGSIMNDDFEGNINDIVEETFDTHKKESENSGDDEF